MHFQEAPTEQEGTNVHVVEALAAAGGGWARTLTELCPFFSWGGCSASSSSLDMGKGLGGGWCRWK